MYDRLVPHGVPTLTAAGGAGAVVFGEVAHDPTMAAGGHWAMVLALVFLLLRIAADYLAHRWRSDEQGADALAGKLAQMDGDKGRLEAICHADDVCIAGLNRERVKLEFENAELSARVKALEYFQAHPSESVLSINEARAARGLPPVEGSESPVN